MLPYPANKPKILTFSKLASTPTDNPSPIPNALFIKPLSFTAILFSK